MKEIKPYSNRVKFPDFYLNILSKAAPICFFYPFKTVCVVAGCYIIILHTLGPPQYTINGTLANSH